MRFLRRRRDQVAMNLQVPQVGGVTRSVRYSIAGAMGGDGRQSVCLIPFAADRKVSKMGLVFLTLSILLKKVCCKMSCVFFLVITSFNF